MTLQFYSDNVKVFHIFLFFPLAEKYHTQKKQVELSKIETFKVLSNFYNYLYIT